MDAFAGERAWVRRILERERPDFVHAHWLYEFALGALDTGLSHLVTAHDAPWTILGLQIRQHPRGIPYRAVRTAMAYLAGRRSRGMTAVSPYVATHLRRYSFTSAPIEIIPNGFPSSCFESSPSPRRSHEKTTFVSILNGGFYGLKNGPGLLKALVRLAKKTERFRLVVFGDGCGPGSEAERLARTLGIAHLVEFRGHVPHAQLLAFLSTEADAVVHPSLEESFGNTLVEGMACGLPVIGGKASGAVPWTLGGGEAGILSDVEDAGELSLAMLELALSPELRWAIGSRAKEYAREHYHIERTADGFEASYARARSCALGQP
ncbi:MAG: glycosyltransferase [Holophagaceae bacterium]|nr:glycosyltransferase [Holophagaceae bacterium]